MKMKQGGLHSLVFVSLLMLAMSFSGSVHAQAIIPPSPNSAYTFNPSWYDTHPTSVIPLSNGTSITIQNNKTNPSILQEIPLRNNYYDPLGNTGALYIPKNLLLGTELNIPLPISDWYAPPDAGFDRNSLYPYRKIGVTSTIKQNEDKIIDFIARGGKPIVVGEGGLSIPKYVGVEVPMSNCVKILGNGPVSIIFSRGMSLDFDATTMVWAAQEMIENGFKKIDPFKSYIDSFTFYVDLKRYDENLFVKTPTQVINPFSAFDFSVFPPETQSSCPKKTDPKSDRYIFFTTTTHLNSDIILGYAGQGSNKVVISYTNRFSENLPELATVLMHELGHTYFLFDEYAPVETLKLSSDKRKNLISFGNCAYEPLTQFSSGNIMYASLTAFGNPYPDCVSKKIEDGRKVYKASPNSIMGYNLLHATPENTKFNVISCGWIVSGILEELNPTKITAEKHWPAVDTSGNSRVPRSLDGKPMGCGPFYDADRKARQGYMDTIVEGIPKLNKKAGATSIRASAANNNSYDVTGIDFTPENNAVQLSYLQVLSFWRSPLANTASVIDSGYKVFLAFLENILYGTKNISNLALVVAATPTVGQTFDISGLPSTNNGTSLTFTVPPEVPNGKYKVSVGAFNSPWTDTTFTINVTNSTATGDPGTQPPVTTNPTDIDPPSNPSAPTIQVTALNSSTIRINTTGRSWTKNGITYYPKFNIYNDQYGESVIASEVGNESRSYFAYDTVNHDPGTRQCYRVAAVAGTKVSGLSAQECATTPSIGSSSPYPLKPGVLKYPDITSKALGLTSLQLWFAAKDLETGDLNSDYDYYIAKDNGTTYSNFSKVPAANLLVSGMKYGDKFTVDGLEPGKKYCHIGYASKEGKNVTTTTSGGATQYHYSDVLLVTPPSVATCVTLPVLSKPTLSLVPGQASIKATLSTANPGATFTIVASTTKAVVAQNIATSTHVINNLVPGVKYCYYAYTNLDGLTSPSSPASCATTTPVSANIESGPTTNYVNTYYLKTNAKDVITSVDYFLYKRTSPINYPVTKILSATTYPWNVSIDRRTIPGGTYSLYAVINYGGESVKTAEVGISVGAEGGTAVPVSPVAEIPTATIPPADVPLAPVIAPVVPVAQPVPPPESGSLTVVSPNTYTQYKAGSGPYSLSWKNVNDGPALVNVSVTKDDGTVTVLATNITGTSATSLNPRYSWTIPASFPPGLYKLNVKGVNSTLEDSSDAFFRILTPSGSQTINAWTAFMSLFR